MFRRSLVDMPSQPRRLVGYRNLVRRTCSCRACRWRARSLRRRKLWPQYVVVLALCNHYIRRPIMPKSVPRRRLLGKLGSPPHPAGTEQEFRVAAKTGGTIPRAHAAIAGTRPHAHGFDRAALARHIQSPRPGGLGHVTSSRGRDGIGHCRSPFWAYAQPATRYRPTSW